MENHSRCQRKNQEKTQLLKLTAEQMEIHRKAGVRKAYSQLSVSLSNHVLTMCMSF